MTLTVCMVINSRCRHNMESLSASPNQLMVTSWPGLAFRSTGHLWGQTTGQRWISFTKCQTCELFFFFFFFDVNLSKPLYKQSSCRWVDTPWRSCDIAVMLNGKVRRQMGQVTFSGILSGGQISFKVLIEYYLGITSSQYTVFNLILFTSW